MSTPNWWGDWRPTLTPHTGNLQATDLIECTSIVGGLPVNTAITGAQIIAAASSGATWGSITGTLSSQTDLQTALNGKQATLVSATNIKTINGNSILGSGDLTVGGSGLTIGTTAITSGTIGRVLFQGTGNVLQQSANLFWDNTNNRLGVGTSTPSSIIHSVGSVTASSAIARGNYFNNTLVAAANNDVLVGVDIQPTFTNGSFTGVTNANIRLTNNTTSYGILSFGGAEEIATEQIAAKFNTSTTGKELAVSLNNTSGRHWKIRSLSSGDFDIRNITNSITPATFSATGLATFRNNINFDLGKSYLGQQFAGGTGLWLNKNTFTTSTYSLWSDGTSTYFNTTSSGTINFRINNADKMLLASTGNFLINTTTDAGYKLDVNGTARIQSKLSVGTPTAASAVMEVTSTTQGFLPPRMTNAQMLAIATPAAGLVVYDTTNNKHCGYNGTAWQNFY